MFDRLINKIVGNVAATASQEIGKSVGNAVGNMVTEGSKSITNEMAAKNQERQIEIKQQALDAKLSMEAQEKAANLPPLCPHCGATTNNKIVCEYCDCKIVE